MRYLLILAAAVFTGCAPAPRPVQVPKQTEPSRPSDESQRFPTTNLVSKEVVDKQLMGKSFMPGGTLVHYKKGGKAWDMFCAKLPTATDAAILLPDWNKALSGSKLEPSFGGYFGQDNGRPVFVFAKGHWIAGIAGLPEKEADAQARVLAAQLN